MLKKRIIVYPLLFIIMMSFAVLLYYLYFQPPKTYNGTFVYKCENEKKVI